MTDDSDDAPRGRQELRRALDILQAASATPAEAFAKLKRQPARVSVESPKEELSKSSLKLRDRRQNMRLRMQLAWFAIIVVSVQLAVANVFFGHYLLNVDEVDTTVMVAWLSATVVEVIGIVVIIARNLFPSAKAMSKNDLRKIMRAVESGGD